MLSLYLYTHVEKAHAYFPHMIHGQVTAENRHDPVGVGGLIDVDGSSLRGRVCSCPGGTCTCVSSNFSSPLIYDEEATRLGI